MKRFLAILLIASTLLSSCGTQSKVQYISCYDDYCTRYIGKSHKQLISDLGAPNRETSDGDGGTIIIYEKITEHHNLSSTGNINSQAKTNVTTHSFLSSITSIGTSTGRGTINLNTQGTTTSTVSFLHLYINSDGVCYNIDTNHTRIEWIEIAQEKEREKDPKKKKTLAIVFGSMAAVFAVTCGVGAIAYSR